MRTTLKLFISRDLNVTSYATAVLGQGESIVYRAVVSHWAYARSYCVCAALLTVGAAVLMQQPHGPVFGFGVLAAGAAVLTGVSAFIAHRTTELVLTDRCLIAKWGLLSRNTVEMALNRVESLHVTQTVPGRLLNYADVTVVGVGASLEPLHGIKNPLELRRRIGASLHERR